MKKENLRIDKGCERNDIKKDRIQKRKIIISAKTTTSNTNTTHSIPPPPTTRSIPPHKTTKFTSTITTIPTNTNTH